MASLSVWLFLTLAYLHAVCNTHFVTSGAASRARYARDENMESFQDLVRTWRQGGGLLSAMAIWAVGNVGEVATRRDGSGRLAKLQPEITSGLRQ